jgi:hypothetical protein
LAQQIALPQAAMRPPSPVQAFEFYFLLEIFVNLCYNIFITGFGLGFHPASVFRQKTAARFLGRVAILKKAKKETGAKQNV